MFVRIFLLHQILRNVCENLSSSCAVVPKKSVKDSSWTTCFFFYFWFADSIERRHTSFNSRKWNPSAVLSVLDVTSVWWWRRCNKLSSFTSSALFVCLYLDPTHFIYPFVCSINRFFILSSLSLCVCIGETGKQYSMYSIKYFSESSNGKKMENPRAWKKWRESGREKEPTNEITNKFSVVAVAV